MSDQTNNNPSTPRQPSVSLSPCLLVSLSVCALTALAAVLRLLGLGHESIWYDETCTLDLARSGYLDMLTGRKLEPSNPAGYFMLLRAWMEMLGSHSIETARSFSAVMGALSVPAVWLLARAVGATTRTGLLACLLVAISPPLVYLGQEARCYALLITLTTLALAAVAFIERDNRPAAWIGFALVGILIVHVHYFGFFVLTVLGLHLLAVAWTQRRPALVLRLGVVACVVALGFAHYVPAMLEQMRLGQGRAKGIWWEHLGMMPAFSIIGRTLIWKEAGRFAVMASVGVVCLTIFLPAFVLLSRFRTWPRLLPTFVIGLPALMALISLRLPMISSHYLSVTFTALLLLIAWAVDAGLRSRSRWLVAPLMLTLALFMLPALARIYLVKHKTDWRAVSARVAEVAPDLPAYFYEDIGEDPFGYYRPEQPRYRLHKEFEGGDGWTKAGYFEQFRADRGGFWFIFYGTNPDVVAEEGRIVERLKKEYDVDCDEKFGPMRLLLLRPADAVLTVHHDRGVKSKP